MPVRLLTSPRALSRSRAVEPVRLERPVVMAMCMNDSLAFLPSLTLLVHVVTRRMLEQLVVDALLFLGELRVVVVVVVWSSCGRYRARPVRVGRHHGLPRATIGPGHE